MTWQEGLTTVGDKTVHRIAIRKPIWHRQSVGIATWRCLQADIIEVKVMYRLKKAGGKEFIPDVLSIPSAEALAFPRQDVSGVELCLVPLAAFKEVTARPHQLVMLLGDR